MAETIRELMTTEPLCLDSDTPLVRAAQCMRDRDIGDVLVVEQGRLRGLVTDRDVVVRAVANGRDPSSTPVGAVCSPDLVCLDADTPVPDAVRVMAEYAIRRIPVVDGERPVGIVSLGDLARDRDPKSALGAISAAPAN